MNKQWAESGLMEGAFYILDRNMHSHQIKFNGTLYPGTIISNGLADGGKNADGSNIIFWAESVGTAERLNVYRGNFCSKTNNVKDIRVFATHTAITDGAEGRPDGANMVNLFEKAAYAVSVLQIGEIRIFDCQLGTLLAKIKLPHGMTNNTKFAIGQDKQGRGVMFVTSLNFDYGNKQLANSLNGSTGMFLLPSAITLHSASIQITDYPSMEEIKTKL